MAVVLTLPCILMRAAIESSFLPSGMIEMGWRVALPEKKPKARLSKTLISSDGNWMAIGARRNN